MPRRPNNSDPDLDADFDFDIFSDVRRRLELIEKRNANASKAERISAEARALHEGTNPDDTDDPDVARGEQVLAKAQDAFHRIGTSEDVLQCAQKVMVSPVDIGIVQGFLAVGTPESFAKAVSLVAEQEDRNARAHAETVVGGMLDNFEQAEDTHNLRDELTDLRQQIATLTGRLVQLESRPTSAPQEIVAKGYERTSAPSSSAKNDAASLLQRGQGVIDSATTIGVLSSLINDGKLREARSMVEAAELDHEAKVKAAERKRLR